MLRAMHSSASGMKAQQLFLDTVAHNLANVNTTAYKKNRIGFEDLLYQTLRPASAGSGADGGSPVALEIGHGSRPVDTQRLYSQGDSEVSGNPLDLLIQGNGFFEVTKTDGTSGYTRDGSFRIDNDGRMVTAQGYVLNPEVTLPDDAVSVAIGRDGRIVIEQAGTTGSTEIGQILVARFTNPAGMIAEGQNLLRASGSSGDAQLGTPDELGFGALIQGALERSNVEVVDEMIQMIVAQRAFEVNSKAIQSADEMMRTAANLRV